MVHSKTPNLQSSTIFFQFCFTCVAPHCMPDNMNNNGDHNNQHILTNLSLTTSTSTTAPMIGSSRRRSSTQILRPGKTEEITAPYDWATKRRATVQSMQYLMGNGINSINGRVQCKRCDRQFEIEYDLQAKFREVADFIMKYREGMRHRAPPVWMNPALPDCRFCEQHNCVKPVLEKKKSINWLFLFLGQMLGCCKLSELKYFCKHTRKHRTGAKDRVLYLTFLELLSQLDPQGSFLL